ncbi:IS200/IS605 family transposase [Streptomyces sp. NBC_01445]|uniref:IS200/IS605 family transposase n=1 Tax=Streptomyces sp. NBC_01445 TaxID=2903869 RepID=UPI002DD8682A|nr:IS200/IS605 family transposase [Streptomyces sp. NBC_01445]WSE02727.1 IS200/IS605 family transposase [Streptomyces sp. NBC_01445]
MVFTPQYRRGPFTDEILRRCEEVMRAVCTDFGAQLREFKGEHDHVHLLVHYSPQGRHFPTRRLPQGRLRAQDPSGFPGDIRTYLWGDRFWSPSYFAASCAGAPLSIIKKYIENQRRPG